MRQKKFIRFDSIRNIRSGLEGRKNVYLMPAGRPFITNDRFIYRSLAGLWIWAVSARSLIAQQRPFFFVVLWRGLRRVADFLPSSTLFLCWCPFVTFRRCCSIPEAIDWPFGKLLGTDFLFFTKKDNFGGFKKKKISSFFPSGIMQMVSAASLKTPMLSLRTYYANEGAQLVGTDREVDCVAGILIVSAGAPWRDHHHHQVMEKCLR